METLIFYKFTFISQVLSPNIEVFLQLEEDRMFCPKEIDLGKVK